MIMHNDMEQTKSLAAKQSSLTSRFCDNLNCKNFPSYSKYVLSVIRITSKNYSTLCNNEKTGKIN